MSTKKFTTLTFKVAFISLGNYETDDYKEISHKDSPKFFRVSLFGGLLLAYHFSFLSLMIEFTYQLTEEAFPH